MKHLVWIEPHPYSHDIATIQAARSLAAPASTSPSRNRIVEMATVQSIRIGARQRGNSWETTIIVRIDGGASATETSYRLPEELTQFEPGRQVQIIRDQPSFVTVTRTCIILPRVL